MSETARVRDILYASWRSARNLPRSQQEGGWLRVAVLAVLGIGVWAGIFGGSYWFFGKVLALEPFGEILVRKILGMAFIAIFGVLCFSNVIGAFSSLLLADDLQFLVARPLSSRTFFAARFFEHTAAASWMVLLFGLPLFLAAGLRFSAPLEYYAWLVAVLVPFVVIPAALASIVVLLLAVAMPVQRTREIFIALGAIAFVGAFVMLRQLELEQLFRPGRFGSTMEFFATLQTPGRYWLPSSWAVELLYPVLARDTLRGTSWLHVAVLYSTAAGLYALATWTFGLCHARAYSRAQAGRHARELKGDAGHEVATRASARSAARTRIEAWVEREVRRPERVLTPTRAIAWKDLRVFVRDTVQWSQLLLLAGLIVVYLANISGIGDFGRGGIFGPVGIYFLNVGLSGFLVAALSVRLVFPAVSLEGKAFWLVRRAPIGLRRYLAAKWLGHVPNLLVLALVLTVLSNWTLGTAWWLTLKSLALVAFLAVGLTGLGVGMGAMFPRFHIDNAARIATGLGGILYMLVAIAVTLVVIALDAWPTFHLMRVNLGFARELPQGFWLRAVACWSAAVGVCLGSALAALTLGARRLGR